MASITLENIGAAYGSTPVLAGVDLAIASGELHTLLGRSGCGKTTLLRLVAGFLTPTSGRILVDGEDVSTLPPEKRRMGVVFQSYALFPQMTVAQNITYGLRISHVPKAKRVQIVDDLIDLLGLGDVKNRNAQELSGGQQQRVAVARALAPSPSMLLMDEPMANLDVELRVSLREEIKRIQRTTGVTTLFVTHDQAEALAISDRITVMEGGVLQQTGTPREIYEAPANEFVATFVGKSNKAGDVFARPEALRLVARSEAARPDGRLPENGATSALSATVEKVLYAGSTTAYTVRVGEGSPTFPYAFMAGQQVEVLMLNNSTSRSFSVGDVVWLQTA